MDVTQTMLQPAGQMLPVPRMRHTLAAMIRRSRSVSRLLATVMFTDIVQSTELAAEIGDRAWKQLVSRHNAVIRRELKRYRGRELDTAGDGFFTLFESPGEAIACAASIIAALRPLGIVIRTGIHTGETEVMGSKVSGIAVHVAARVLSQAQPGQILVTGTVRDIASGSGIEFEDRGAHQLKGVPGTWHLYALAALPHPVEADATADDELTSPRREVRSALPWVLFGAAALAVGVGTALAATSERGEPELGPNTIVGVNPGDLEVNDAAPLGTQPIAVVAGFDALWVANFGDRTVQQLDPTTGESLRTIALSAGGNPTDLAVGGEFVWVASGIDGVISRVNPQTGAIRLIEVGVGVSGVAFGNGSIWATNGQTNELLRIDPETERVDRVRLEGDSQPLGVAVGEGSVWVAEHLAARIARVDPASMQVIATIPLRRGQPERIAIGLGNVWVTVPSADSVLRIDPRTDEATAVEAVGDGPMGLAVDESAVWVANAGDGSLARIDPETLAVDSSIELGFPAVAVAAVPGRVWVVLAE